MLQNPRACPGNPAQRRIRSRHTLLEAFRHHILQGLKDGWVAQTPPDGQKYRRGRNAPPTAESNFFSITTVYMSTEEEYRGQYHAHPYGEINCVILLDEGSKAELTGMQGWQGAGWTRPGPGTHHYPEVGGGELVGLFFLPAGRISYEAQPGMPQPVSL